MHIHKFIESDKAGYEYCECGTYHSVRLCDPKYLYENDYWSHKHGHSTIEEQIYNVSLEFVHNKSKVDKALSYFHTPGRLLEVGCAPGVLLNRARIAGYDVWGIEPDRKVVEEVLLVSGCDKSRIMQGYFPKDFDFSVQKFDYFVAMDVLEHVEDYEKFIKTANDLLVPGGHAVFMLPIIKDGKYMEKDFAPHEHAWMFSYDFITGYMKECGLWAMIAYDMWKPGHELLILKK